MRVAPDDDVYRVNAVWLGPKGLTFPWTARYLAYGLWLAIFVTILAVEGLAPGLSVGVPPMWELAISILATYALMGLVDHDTTLRSLWQTFCAELTAPRTEHRTQRTRIVPRVRVRENA